MKRHARARRSMAAGALALGGLAAVIAPATSADASTGASTSNSVIEFQLYNPSTGACADLPGAGAPTLNDQVWQDTCIGGSGDNQMWYATQVGTASNGWPLYSIRNTLSTPPAGGNLCLDLPGYGSDPEGSYVYTYSCTSPASSDNQEWEILPVYTSTGTYLGSEIQNYKSDNYCLDVAGWLSNGTDKNGRADLTVYQCANSAWANHGLDDHTWELRESNGADYLPPGGTSIIVN